MLTSIAPAAAEVGVALEGRFDAGLPTVKGDPAKLRQAYGNLVGKPSNHAAWWHGEGGGAREHKRWRLGPRA